MRFETKSYHKKQFTQKILFHIFFVVGTVFVLVYFPTSLWHFPDGIGYYSFLPAIFKYKNYDFYKIIRTYTPNVVGTTKNGFVMNDFEIGSSIVWFPVYLVSNLFDSESISIVFTNFYSSILGFGSLFIFFKFLTNKLNFSKKFSLFICLTLLLGTPLLFYSYSIPQNPHTTIACLCSLYLYFLLSKKVNSSYYQRYLLLGLLLGLISAVRVQRIILGICVGIEIIQQLMRRKNFKESFLYSSVFVVGFLIGFSPQLINSVVLFSRLLPIKLYTISLNKYIFSSLYEILFSSYHSVLLWTPLIIISFIGLIFGLKENFVVSLSTILIFIIDTFILATVVSPGGGSSFGIRYYTDLVFILGLGIYFLFNFLQQKKCVFFGVVITSICSVWSFILFVLSTSGYLDLLEVYDIKTFFNKIFSFSKNFNFNLVPRYYGPVEEYLFFILILVSTFFVINKLIQHKTKLFTIVFVLYLIFFNYSIIKAGFFNRVVYKREVFEQSLPFRDFQIFYIYAGIKVRLKYYALTGKREEYEFYSAFRDKLKPSRLWWKRVFQPIFFSNNK